MSRLGQSRPAARETTAMGSRGHSRQVEQAGEAGAALEAAATLKNRARCRRK